METATRELWLSPLPAPADGFLPLEYEPGYPEPRAGTSALYLHPWCQRECMGLAAEVEIVDFGDFGYTVRLYQYGWSVYEGGYFHKFERWSGCEALMFEGPEPFGQFCDAEAYAQFCWQRWLARGSAGAAGMALRDDVDQRFNPL